MSDKTRKDKQRGKPQFDQRPRNFGPAGFSKLEYQGQGHDHVQTWMRFRTQWRSFVAGRFDPLLESIEKESRKPQVPELDLRALAAAQPRQKDDVIATMIFEQKVKTVAAEHEKKIIKLQDQCDEYWTILWNQLGLSMQHQIQTMKDFRDAESTKNPTWLFVATQSFCLGVASVVKKDSKVATLTFLTGLKKNGKYETIHAYYDRWKLAYKAYIASGNNELSASEQIELFNSSLDENYSTFISETQNLQLRNDTTKLPKTLDENFHIAVNYVSPSTVVVNESRAVFYTGDEHAAQRQKKKSSVSYRPTAGTKKNDHRRSIPKKVAGAREERACYGCGEIGHLVKDCPSVAAAGDTEDDTANDTPAQKTDQKLKKSSKINAMRMVAAGISQEIPDKFLIAIDNCAHTSVMCDKEYLHDFKLGSCMPLLTWSGDSVANNASGNLHPFGYAEYNKDSPINLLSEYEVKSRFKCYEEWPNTFIVIVGDAKIIFEMNHERRMFMCDWRKYAGKFSYSPPPRMLNVVINSVAQNEAMFTKREVAQAKEARLKIAHSGYMAKDDIMRLASSSGNVINWNLNRADIQRAIDIYGAQNVLHGRSRIIRPDTRVVRAEPLPKRPQDLYTDKMFIGGLCFLLGCAKPLDVLLVKHLTGESEQHLKQAFDEFVAVLESYKYDTSVIYSDVDSAVVANINALGKVRVETCSAGDHVNEAESRIKPVKERFRSIISGLNFTLFKRLIIELVYYVVGRLNLSISQFAQDGLCPRVRLTESLIDANKELNIGFGHLVVARNKNAKSNDALILRGEVCITLRPVGNRQGSWRMMKLVNGRIVNRSQFREVPMTDIAKARLDELAIIAAAEDKSEAIGIDEDTDFDEPEDIGDDEYDYSNTRDVVLDFPLSYQLLQNVKSEVKLDDSSELVQSEVGVIHDNDGTIPQLVDDDDDDEEVAEMAVPAKQEQAQAHTTFSGREYKSNTQSRAERAQRRGGQINSVINKTSYVRSGNYSITPKTGAKKYGVQKSLQSQYKELLSLYENGTFEGVLPKDLSGQRRRKIIRSFMIMKEKFDAEGTFEMIKARLVANGAQMDPTTFTDLSSPTVSLTFLFIMVAIAAREGREVATMDVGSAFVKASMDGEEEVLVALDRLSSALLIKIDPSFEKFLDHKQEMTVKLKKALYGCLQSARLWFQLLVKELKLNGYEQNAIEPCVLNKTVDGLQSTILLHVDDIKVLSQIPGEAKKLHKYLEDKFGKVTLHEGLRHNYLGMTFNYEIKGKVSVTMNGYEQDLIKDWEELEMSMKGSSAATPACNDIFEKGESENLGEKNKAIFHSYVMRVAYLAKRVKPELNVGVSYLSTQVTKPNLDDLKKLDRIIRYIRDHIGEGITLISAGEGKDVHVTGHIDASFGSHENGKSHTGVFVTLGYGPVFVRSVKQRIVTKSSTEAELVALSDEAGVMFHIEDFIRDQGYKCVMTIGQDNQSTITMITNNRKESMRTRHIKVRYFWLKERIKRKELSVVYVPTGNMLADFLTKPMQGNLYRHFMRKFCCRDEVIPARK